MTLPPDPYYPIEQRLISTAKFQLDQVLTLQDDEIARLKELLRKLRSRIRITKTNYDSKINRMRLEKIQIEKELQSTQLEYQQSIHQEKSYYRNTYSTLANDFITKTNALTAELKEFSKVDTSKLASKYQLKPDPEFEAICQELRLKISETICTPPSSTIDTSAKMLEISREEENIQQRKSRVEQLQREITRIKSEMSYDQQRTTTQLESIQSQIARKIDDISNIRTQSFSTISITNDSIQINENSDIQLLKNQINSKKEYITQLNIKINKLKLESSKQISSATEEYTELKNELSNTTINPYSTTQHEIEELQKKIKDDRKKLSLLDPELSKQRNLHLQLLSAIKATDYSLNGRYGEYQRIRDINSNFSLV